MKRMIIPAMAIGLGLALTPEAQAWKSYLDFEDSMLPPVIDPSATGYWQAFTDPPTEGSQVIVDIGGTKVLRMDSTAHSDPPLADPHHSNEYYSVDGSYVQVGAARFRLHGFTPTGKENLLAVSSPVAAPSITLVDGEYWVWSYLSDEPIFDLGPAVTNQFHTAYIQLRDNATARVNWDDVVVFDGPVPTVPNGHIDQGLYVEFGSGTYWQTTAGTIVDFDWVGWGDVSDMPAQLYITRDAGKVVVSWSTNNPGFALQCTTSLPSTNWVNVTNVVSVVDDRYTVTNDVAGIAKFYRLLKLPPPPPDVVVNFADLSAGAVPGSYAGLDWPASSSWAVGGSWAGITSQSAYWGTGNPADVGRIEGGTGGPFLLKSLRATADSNWTLSLIDNNGQTASMAFTANTPATLTTGWTTNSAWVDVTSSVGFNAVIDDITYFR